jgi:hypothetical protein
MIFKRTQHDGLYGVLNRQGFTKIVFNAGQYETEDPEECKTLMEMGYAYEGELPAAKAPPPSALKWQAVKIEGGEVVDKFKTKKETEDWILAQENWAEMEVAKVK